MKNKSKFKTSELILRVPIILVGLWIIIKGIVDSHYPELLIFVAGGAMWEYSMFFLYRFGIFNPNKHWNYKNEEDERT